MGYIVQEDDVGTLYFACDIGSHCDDGQKIQVEVSPSADVGTSTADSDECAEKVLAYYKLDESDMDGAVADSTGQVDAGTIYGASYAPGPYGDAGQALQFDGVDDYVEVEPWILVTPSAFPVGSSLQRSIST